jgi:hypothetical protein
LLGFPFHQITRKSAMSTRVTLLDPPPQDHSKAAIENVLDLTPVVDLGPVLRPSPFSFQQMPTAN